MIPFRHRPMAAAMPRSTKPASSLRTSLLLGIAGCIPSLFPIYNEHDAVVRDQILGRWTSDDQSQTWTFTKGDKHAYQLQFVEKEGRQASFVARLTEINEVLFMDLYPRRSGEPKPGLYNLHVISAHTFYRLELDQDSLSLAFLDPRWLKKYHNEHPGQLSHTRHDESVLLTADTQELRRFVRKHLDTDGAFTKPFTLKKAG